jgi:hypothetical protein
MSLKVCPICKKESKALHMHLKTHKVETPTGLKTQDTGDKEADFIFLLENNELPELRKAGVEIPHWRYEMSKYPHMNKSSFKGIRIKFVGQFEK